MYHVLHGFYTIISTYSSLLSVHSAEHNGRLRKYYHITEQGQKRLEYFKAEWNEIVSIYEFVTREDKNNA